MKRKLFFFIAAMLIFGTMTAQEHHYQMPDTQYGNNMTMKARICIDGVEQQSIDVIEIGVFDGEAVTDSKFLKVYGSSNYHRVNFTIGGGNDDYAMTFKLFNHETNEELLNYVIYDPDGNVCETLMWHNDGNYGSYKNPYTLDFVTVQTLTMDIEGYNTGDGKYYLIATPFGNIVDITNTENTPHVENLLTNAYDLYYFDQSHELEWINYKGENGQFGLTTGKGYLYANSDDVTLTFVGNPIDAEEYTVYLDKVAGAELEGWNLVGNPFAQTAYITKSFYIMNDAGDKLIPGSGNSIPAMEAVFVEATDDQEEMVLSINNKQSFKVNHLVLSLNSSKRSSTIDRTIVSFDGSELSKLELFEGKSKLYIPQNGKDYAIVKSEDHGMLPLNFKAGENGTYTISFNTENVEMGYLHLIDNLTGNDVDLLASNSYSFEATTSDYESRFKLVFATGNAADDHFAFYSNGNLIINNTGEATLQVVDVTGRILSSETINGCYTTNVEAAPGVYMLNLINGNGIKTQKIIVK